jgi:hypothetical protein
MRDTIDMAREAGFNVKMFKPPVITAQHSNGSWVSVGDELKAFEALVRADEREACANVCEAHKIDGQLVHSNAVVGCAAAIRARSKD